MSDNWMNMKTFIEAENFLSAVFYQLFLARGCRAAVPLLIRGRGAGGQSLGWEQVDLDRPVPGKPESLRCSKHHSVVFCSPIVDEMKPKASIGDLVMHSALTPVLTAFSGSVRRERRAWRKLLRRCFDV